MYRRLSQDVTRVITTSVSYSVKRIVPAVKLPTQMPSDASIFFFQHQQVGALTRCFSCIHI